MLDTIGKKLTQARQAQGLSIEEAAHATRIRPDKLIALEHNDYSRFGSNAYAKGFLQIYGKFLGVDVSEIARTLETPRQVSISDYQYLNSIPDEPPVRQRSQPKSRSLHAPRPSIVPLVLMIFAMLVAVGSLMAYWINVTSQRLEGGKENRASTAAAEQTAPATPEGTANSDANALATEPHRTGPAAGTSTPPAPALREEPVEVRRAEPVLQPFAPAPGASPATPNSPQATAVVTTPTGVNEIVVEPLRKTKVKIRKDSPTSAPIFEDYLYPNAPPLVLRGTKFFVEVSDQDAVQIRKNGSPIAYQAPGISIQ
jgi:cytoskeletal protein RodZ